uniref:Transposase n=1 Tax=Panagrellus redivivus TaxID=6233 RepID=A0A7E4VSW6_PANRE
MYTDVKTAGQDSIDGYLIDAYKFKAPMYNRSYDCLLCGLVYTLKLSTSFVAYRLRKSFIFNKLITTPHV